MTKPRYRRARELAGLSLAQASRRLGWDRQALDEHETGHADPRYPLTEEEQRRMADTYHCSLDWMLGGDPVLSDEAKRLLRDERLDFADRDRLAEVLGSMPTKERP